MLNLTVKANHLRWGAPQKLENQAVRAENQYLG
jgi:hypothetical protein